MTHNKRLKHGGFVGGKEQPLHYVWRSMLARCYNPNDKSFAHYGGRGITVCERWRNDYLAFAADMGERPSPRMSIERHDVDGPYAPSNCYWATASEQQRNKTSTRYYFNGYLALTLVEAADLLGISKELAHWRFRTFGSFEKGAAWHELPKAL
jgi:hypothetical protein